MAAGGRILKISETREKPGGAEVSVLVKVLRLWESGGRRMALVGDETGLTRIGLGELVVEEGEDYRISGLAVERWTGGWHSLVAGPNADAAPANEPVEVKADDSYVQRVYKILTGLKRKRERMAAQERTGIQQPS